MAFKREGPFISVYNGTAESYKQALFFGYYCLVPEIKDQVTLSEGGSGTTLMQCFFCSARDSSGPGPCCPAPPAQHQNMRQLFPTLQGVSQKYPGLAQPPVLLTWLLLQGKKTKGKWKRNGQRVVESKNQIGIWKKKKMHYGGQEGRRIMKNNYGLVSSLSLYIWQERERFYNKTYFSQVPTSWWLRHLTQQASMVRQMPSPVPARCS